MIIHDLVDSLTQVQTIPGFKNYYEGINGIPYANNLENYLSEMKLLKPTVLLVGEAAGPHGVGRTGIPFTDEVILGEKPIIDGNTIFINDYSFPLLGKTLKPEKSAQRMWEAIKNADKLPLLWNAVPFYPYDPITNKIRNPSGVEKKACRIYLKSIFELFPSINRVIAIGKQAHPSIRAILEWPLYIKHPSRSKVDFIAKTTSFLKDDFAMFSIKK